jgi:hypothetical protein
MDKVEQGKAAKKRTISDIRREKKAVIKKVTIQLDGEVAAHLNELRDNIEEAKRRDVMANSPDTAPAAQVALDKAIEAAKETAQVFEFHSIGRFEYDKLVSKPTNRPTKEQKKEGMDFNPDTFPPELVSASCVDPEIPLEDAQAIFSDPDWNAAELQRLFYCALEVNNETGDVPLSKSGSDQTLNSLLNSLMQQKEESPTPSM